MTEQPPLFVESWEEACSALIVALGGRKKVGTALRPELGAEAAARWLSDCLNADKREHFTIEQVAWLRREGREIGCHILMHYEAREAGYADPQTVDPEDEIAELQRAVITRVDELKRLVPRIENLTKRRR